jgi:hypothetical protein
MLDPELNRRVIPPSPSALAQWAATPVGVANARTVGGHVLVLCWVVAVALYTTDASAAIRNFGIAFFVLHATVYAVTLGLLRRLKNQGRTDAAAGLAAYRNPMRINNFDLAMLWGAAALLADLTRSL